MTDFYSRNDVNYNGDVYSIPFPYMKEEEIQVYLDDVLFTDWFFLQDTQLRLRSIPAGTTSDTIVSVRRVTNIDDKVVTYTNNTLLNKENLNLSQDQLLFAVQELYDNNTQFQSDTAEVIETNKQELLDIQEAFEQETQQQLLQNKTEIENRVTQFENEVNNTIDEVKEAANKVNQLEDAVDTAVTAANTATEQAGIAINKANETTEIVEQFTENIDSKISTNNENMQSVLAETEAVLQEAKDTLNDTLNKSQITNCLLEVPQNIKLELNDGKLTLKAGSEVIVPKGFEADGVTRKFDYVTIESDLSKSSFGSLSSQQYLIYENDINIINHYSKVSVFSGDTQPTTIIEQYNLWYDTKNNVIKISTDTGASWNIREIALPLGLFTRELGVPVSIDQVFNGMGYIGSTIWVDKGVKGLIPNGRNEDGSLKNYTDITNNVLTVTASKSKTAEHIRLAYDRIQVGNLDYDAETNYNYLSGQEHTPTYIRNLLIAGTYASDANGVITSLQPKLPVRLLTADDIKINNPYFFGQYIWSEFAPDNLSWLKSSGQWNSGTGYQAFYDWALANANANKAGFKLSTASYTDYDFVVNTSAKTFRLPIKVKQTFFNSGDVPVVGNGNSLGLTNGGTTLYNISNNPNPGYFYPCNNVSGFKVPLGSAVSDVNAQTAKTFGITTDASKSGLVAKLSSVEATGLSLYFYVGETVRDAFLIDVAQIASNFADKIGRTECKAYITQTYVNGTSWYRIYSDGWCEQGGIVTRTTASAGYQKISLLKSYNSTNYNILTGQEPPTDATTFYYPQFRIVSTSSFKIYSQSSSANSKLYWQACGYIA